ncbi:histidine--tRNA ligase [Candidatus Pacearchaeota archaeon]|nr:histidine--tRNA ligase [Candidatus Pacearchaeota archaeon]
MKTDLVKGFKDYSGEEAEKRAEIKKILVGAFEKYGFEPAETPIIEYGEFVKGNNSQDEAVSDIFKLKDKGKRNLALRYELTFPLKRIMKNQKLPYRTYRIGEVFRDEPVSANRFRQFTQCDVDVVGSTIKEDSEIISIANKIFKELKIPNEIFVGNRKLLNEIFDEQKIDKKYKEQVLREIDKLDKLPEKKIRENLKKFGAEKVLVILKKPEPYFKKYQSYSEIEELKKYCKYYGVKIIFSVSLVRGLSYYNGNVFEIKSSGMKETICAGGTYQINNLQAVGISFGIERIEKLSGIKIEKKEILIISIGQDRASIKLAEKLRGQGENVMIYYGKPSKALEYANSKKISKVIFVGGKEVASGKFKIKCMESGGERYERL